MADRLEEITIEDAQIRFRNFAGAPDTFNPNGGKPQFGVLIDPKNAPRMEELGWNVKYLKPREDDEEGFRQPYIMIAVSYKFRPPTVVMIGSKGRQNLEEKDLILLDWADIAKVDLMFTASHWEVNGKTGVKAYLKSIFVTINESALDLKYANIPDAAEQGLLNASQAVQARLHSDGPQFGDSVGGLDYNNQSPF